jgi:hypothetical protein
MEDVDAPGAISASKCVILEKLALIRQVTMIPRRLEVISPSMS